MSAIGAGHRAPTRNGRLHVLSETELRVRALETILTEKGYVDAKALDAIVEAYETKIGPHIGARAVARRPAAQASRVTA